MKSSLLSISFVLFTVCSVLAQGTGSITVFAENGERFWFILDGNRINQAASHNVKVEGLKKAWYRSKVIFEDETIPSIDQNVGIQDIETNNFMDVTYIVKQNNFDKWVMRVSSFSEAASNNTAQVMKYDDATGKVSGEVTQQPANQTTVTTTSTTTTQTAPNQTTTVKTDFGGLGSITMQIPNINVNMQTEETYTESSTSMQSTTNQTTTQSTPAPAAAPSNTCTTAMATSDFNSAKSSIKNQSFTDGQMKVAKQILRSNCLNVNQIIEVMGIFSYEESKLEFAKAAYPKCVDKGSYFRVNDAFTFSGSVDELNEFLDAQ
jgi:hypothetical protein